MFRQKRAGGADTGSGLDWRTSLRQVGQAVSEKRVAHYYVVLIGKKHVIIRSNFRTDPLLDKGAGRHRCVQTGGYRTSSILEFARNANKTLYICKMYLGLLRVRTQLACKRG
jgi:hypothetical protein